jgi:hypothetical protein
MRLRSSDSHEDQAPSQPRSPTPAIRNATQPDNHDPEDCRSIGVGRPEFAAPVPPGDISETSCRARAN